MAGHPDITAEDLHQRILDILEYGSILYNNPHLFERMRQRGYSIADVYHILKNGKILKFEKQGTERYNCQVHGEDLEGSKGAVVTIVMKRRRMLIVTVLGGM
ncbi:MAG: DUF4258 domain-containing protein [Syntrophales bacterium]|nr:DUF4258 domain-containing protein [Syntrophales bacterium]MDD5232228.1 DUF4258 domain-containing protein [Syntrophales bacterium]MDD5533309.1 DUF4258 domain-containing protein [Syntrophales bacterium]